MNTEEKTKVVTTKKACELLNCKRTKFHQSYRKKLKVFKSENGYNTYYLLSQIQKLVSEDEIKRSNVLLDNEIEIVI